MHFFSSSSPSSTSSRLKSSIRFPKLLASRQSCPLENTRVLSSPPLTKATKTGILAKPKLIPTFSWPFRRRSNPMKRFIALDSITIASNRQRQEFNIEKHQDLVDSIRKHGILHPPIVRLAEGAYILVAGECRLRAMRDIIELGDAIPFEGSLCLTGFVPYTFLGDLNELDAEEAELDENIKRSDLTWQECARATQRLDALRAKQHVARGDAAPTL